MNHPDFNKLLERRLDRTRDVLTAKSKEYSTDDDKLYNFKRGAGIRGKTPVAVCLDYMTKHLVSVLDVLEAAGKGRLPSQELIDEKIGDTINYLILAEACIADEIKERQSKASNGGQPPPSPRPSSGRS